MGLFFMVECQLGPVSAAVLLETFITVPYESDDKEEDMAD